MRRYSRFFIPLAALSILAACAKEVEQAEPQVPVVMEEDDCLIPGEAVICVTEEVAALIEASQAEGTMVPTRAPGFVDALAAVGVTRLERLYPDAGEWEPRHRAAGLHLWYRVSFDTTVPQTRASSLISELAGVEMYEPERRIHSTAVFNDPKLSQQWHYINDGSRGANYRAGADINVLPVWSHFTGGTRNVIVAVEDEGVDMEHEDLAGVCLSAAEGSKSFVYEYGTLSADFHGTHVAGTIAAINNNGKGGCGIAGGRDGKGGVRIMSTQIMKENPADPYSPFQGNSQQAMVWAADHGAVISQNSWGYTYKTAAEAAAGGPGSMKSAVDYFIKYAGCDNDGNQLPSSPMKGGVVIFAAGNEGWGHGWPAEYAPIVAVGAINASLSRSYYSNYGPWVDIAAPGGDQYIDSMVLSTSPGSKYGTSQGTSMACPHVSGVAALIVSYFGGPGFTNEMLLDRLINGANSKVLSANIGPLVDAFGSFTVGGTEPPLPVKDFETSVKSNFVTCTWDVVADPDDVIALGYLVAASKDKAAIENLDPRDPRDVTYQVVSDMDKALGDKMSCVIDGLDFETEYYIGIYAYDYASHYSDLSPIKTVRTLGNSAPVITSDTEGPVVLRSFQAKDIRLTVTDPDGHAYTLEFDGGSPAADNRTTKVEDVYMLYIKGSLADPGKYVARYVVTDAFGASTTFEVPYEILENVAPVVTSSIPNMLLDKSVPEHVLDMTEFFYDEDGETLDYTASSSVPNVVHLTPDGDSMTLTVLGYGITEVTITATDARGKSCSTSFKVIVRDPSKGPDVSLKKNSLTVATYWTGKVSIDVISAAGRTVCSVSEDADAFEPVVIDASGFAPGRYAVKVAMDSQVFESVVVKK